MRLLVGGLIYDTEAEGVVEVLVWNDPHFSNARRILYKTPNGRWFTRNDDLGKLFAQTEDDAFDLVYCYGGEDRDRLLDEFFNGRQPEPA